MQVKDFLKYITLADYTNFYINGQSVSLHKLLECTEELDTSYIMTYYTYMNKNDVHVNIEYTDNYYDNYSDVDIVDKIHVDVPKNSIIVQNDLYLITK